MVQVEGTDAGAFSDNRPTYLQVLHLWVQRTTAQNIPKEITHYVVAKVYHVVRSTVGVSLLNVYRPFLGGVIIP